MGSAVSRPTGGITEMPLPSTAFRRSHTALAVCEPGATSAVAPTVVSSGVTPTVDRYGAVVAQVPSAPVVSRSCNVTVGCTSDAALWQLPQLACR